MFLWRKGRRCRVVAAGRSRALALTYRIAFVLVASGVRVAVVELLLRVEVELVLSVAHRRHQVVPLLEGRFLLFSDLLFYK